MPGWCAVSIRSVNDNYFFADRLRHNEDDVHANTLDCVCGNVPGTEVYTLAVEDFEAGVGFAGLVGHSLWYLVVFRVSQVRQIFPQTKNRGSDVGVSLLNA